MKILLEFEDEKEAKIAMQANYLLDVINRINDKVSIMTAFKKDQKDLEQGLSDINRFLQSTLANLYKI